MMASESEQNESNKALYVRTEEIKLEGSSTASKLETLMAKINLKKREAKIVPTNYIVQ